MGNSKDERNELIEKNESQEIASAENVLNSALSNVSEEKKKEIMEKAAEEALRLQVRKAEVELDDQAAEKMLGRAIRVVEHNSENVGNEISLDDSVQRTDGTTKVQVSPPKGACFIATVAFTDYDHPVVMELRVFRDHWLKRCSLGRAFVAWYYRNGSQMASHLEKRPAILKLTRGVLRLFALTHRLFGGRL